MDSSKPIVEVLEKNNSTNIPRTDEAIAKFTPLWAIRRHVLFSRLVRRRLDNKPQKMRDERPTDERNN